MKKKDDEPKPEKRDEKGLKLLNDYIEDSSIDVKNADPTFPIHNAIKLSTSPSFVQTDCDEQLIVSVAFQVPVRIKYFIIRSPEGDSRPTLVKFFKNKPTMGFDECESDPPTEEFNLTDPSFEKEIPVKFVAF